MEFTKKLIEDIQTNEELMAKCSSTNDPEELTKILNDAGYDVTKEEILTAEKEIKSQISKSSDESIEILSADKFEEVVGGWFDLEEAPDGHDIGCVLTYHGEGWCRDNNTYCRNTYFCNGSRYGGKTCEGPNKLLEN